jgi:hypothetical protein
MDGCVLIQIGFLSEALVASRLSTVKRPFSSVDSEMVEKVMPFPEKHLAAIVVALKKLDISLSTRIFVFVYAELSGLWD